MLTLGIVQASLTLLSLNRIIAVENCEDAFRRNDEETNDYHARPLCRHRGTGMWQQ